VNVGVKSALGSTFGQESSATLLWAPYLLPIMLTGQRYHDFLETVLSGLLQVVPLAVRQREVGVSARTPTVTTRRPWFDHFIACAI
jgi:hypothetical protein